jgi:hypothetical protein
MESVAGITWNGWPEWSGITGRDHLEYSQFMGHTSTKTTEIYLQAIGEEKRKLVLDAWDE